MVVTIENLSFGYQRESAVLSEISFAVPDGQAVAILGPSGVGKSTLLRLIAGLLGRGEIGHFGGAVRLDGTPAPAKLAQDNARIGFVFQEPLLLPFLTARENLLLGGNRSLSRAQAADESLASVGLTGASSKWPHQLSGGMRTRLALARELALQPSLLLLDEPFGALDVVWRGVLYTMIAEARTRCSPTTLLVTHDVVEAVLLSNRIIVLGDGGTVVGDVNLCAAAAPDYSSSEDVQRYIGAQAEIVDEVTLLLQKNHAAYRSRVEA